MGSVAAVACEPPSLLLAKGRRRKRLRAAYAKHPSALPSVLPRAPNRGPVAVAGPVGASPGRPGLAAGFFTSSNHNPVSRESRRETLTFVPKNHPQMS
jgi:hypothetical protein